MADYFSQGAAPTLVGGTGLLGVRKDTPVDLSGGNGNFGVPNLDYGGSIRVSEEGGVPTYYAVNQFTCDSTATDIWYLQGNATTVVKVLWMLITSTATAASAGRLQILKRSTLDTAGTAVAAGTPLPADSRNAAAVSIPKHYTAHPTSLGTLVGTIFTQQFAQQASTTVPAQAAFLMDFRSYFGGQALRLAGTAEILCVNAAASLGGSGNAWDITCCYTELPLTA